MADIGITIDGEVRFQKLTEPVKGRDCLLVDLSKDLAGKPYTRDRIYFHGTVASFREFANRMLAALPPEPDLPATVGEWYA